VEVTPHRFREDAHAVKDMAKQLAILGLKLSDPSVAFD
jgi:hypothetical protein